MIDFIQKFPTEIFFKFFVIQAMTKLEYKNLLLNDFVRKINLKNVLLSLPSFFGGNKNQKED